MPPLTADGEGVVATGDVVGDRFLAIELSAELVEIGHSHLRTEPDRALLRRELTEQEPQECGLAGAVGSDDAHLVAAEDLSGEVSEDRPAAIAKGKVFDRAHEVATAGRLLDHELCLSDLISPLAAFVSHRLERPHAALVSRATGLDALPDPDLLFGQSLVEERVLLFLGSEGIGLASEKRVVVARPIEEPAAVDFPDPRRQFPEKRPVVGDEHERARPGHQEFLQPADGSKIEVIGRLVEKQEGGFRDQLAGQERPPLESGRHRPNLGSGVDLHAGERAFRAFVGLPAFDLVGSNRGIESLPHEGQRLAGEVERHLLREIGDAGAWSHHATTPIRLLEPGDHLQERRLAGAVAAQKPDPLPGLDLPGHAVEERRSAIGDRQVVEVNKGHAGKRWRQSKNVIVSGTWSEERTSPEIARNIAA